MHVNELGDCTESTCKILNSKRIVSDSLEGIGAYELPGAGYFLTLMFRDQRNTQAADIEIAVALIHYVRTLLTCANFRFLSSPQMHCKAKAIRIPASLPYQTHNLS